MCQIPSNPRKGTETRIGSPFTSSATHGQIPSNPRKGTETLAALVGDSSQDYVRYPQIPARGRKPIRHRGRFGLRERQIPSNPRKGTETVAVDDDFGGVVIGSDTLKSPQGDGNGYRLGSEHMIAEMSQIPSNPRKGTETLALSCTGQNSAGRSDTLKSPQGDGNATMGNRDAIRGTQVRYPQIPARGRKRAGVASPSSAFLSVRYPQIPARGRKQREFPQEGARD